MNEQTQLVSAFSGVQWLQQSSTDHISYFYLFSLHTLVNLANQANYSVGFNLHTFLFQIILLVFSLPVLTFHIVHLIRNDKMLFENAFSREKP